MSSSLDTHLLSYMYLTLILFCSFSALSSSSSSCELQAPFRLNRFYKAGELVLGGLFPVHFSSVFPEQSFTSQQKEPSCYG